MLFHQVLFTTKERKISYLFLLFADTSLAKAFERFTPKNIAYVTQRTQNTPKKKQDQDFLFHDSFFDEAYNNIFVV